MESSKGQASSPAEAAPTSTTTATATALSNPTILTRILHALSSLQYKSRRQPTPTSPVSLLEYRPTLVPAILVNKMWAEAGTSVLWRRYPHLPALRGMEGGRRGWYAGMVERVFGVGLGEEGYLEGLAWPKLKAVELEVDFGGRYGRDWLGLLGPGVESLEIAGPQTGGREFLETELLPQLFDPERCHKNLKTLRFGPSLSHPDDPLSATTLIHHLDALPHLTTLDIKGASFSNTNALFMHLAKHPVLETLEIDLEPGVHLLPALSAPRSASSFFPRLKRLGVMCYPEIALALPGLLPSVEELQLDLCRLVLERTEDDEEEEEGGYGADRTVVEALISRLSACPRLTSLKIGIGALGQDFPSSTNLPILSGCSLVLLSQYCPSLEHLNIFAGEPSSIDASDITGAEFERFCTGAKNLMSLVLKLHPATVSSDLSRTALKSLGTHCQNLSILRLRMPSDISALPSSAPNQPLFPQLTHFALARPQSALSPTSPTSPPPSVSPELEAHLVQSWASSLLAHFPLLEVLEAWSGHLGAENESLNYFLPREEALASCWEFLSGCEQDLWGSGLSDEEGDEFLAIEQGGGGEGYGQLSTQPLEEGLYSEHSPLVDDEAYGEIVQLEQSMAEVSFNHWDEDGELADNFVENVSGIPESTFSESTLDWEAASYLNEMVDVGTLTRSESLDLADYVDEEDGEITPGRGLDLDVAYFEKRRGVDVAPEIRI